MTDKRVFEVVLTGGPCSGKTTAKPWLAKYFGERGFKVLFVPEVATMLIDGGLEDIGELDAETYTTVQNSLFDIQGALRNNYLKIAEKFDKPVIVVYDRAEGDIRTYIDDAIWQDILRQRDTSFVEITHSYDLVIHLVSAAVGAVEFYTTDNNTARRETPEEAAALDKMTIDSWLGHPHLKVIDNSTTFDEKMERLLGAVAGVVGVKEPVEVERKFLIEKEPSNEFLDKATAIEISQTYLLSPNEDETRVRSWSQDGDTSYFWTTKSFIEGSSNRVEKETLISYREYKRLLQQADPNLSKISKTRFCFEHEGHHFELDRFEDLDLWILEVELESLDQNVSVPEELVVEREITDEREFYNRGLAER